MSGLPDDIVDRIYEAGLVPSAWPTLLGEIGAVIGADLGKLAQAKPGDQVRFVQCSDAEAVAALRQLRSLEQSVAAWLAEEEERSTGRQFRIVVAGVTYQVQVQEG